MPPTNKMSGLDSNMKCHHTGTQVVNVHMRKAIVLHKVFQGLLVRVHANGLGQITVTGFITGNHLAQQGQNLERIEIVGFFQRFGDLGKL